MSAPTAGAAAIVRERTRQVDWEGWSPEHDLHHADGELLSAALAYARATELRRVGYPAELIQQGIPRGNFTGSVWPWSAVTFKPMDDPRDLARAGALIAAELDRLHQLGAVLL